MIHLLCKEDFLLSYSHLFSPITINSLTLPNRVIMGSMHIGLESEENGFEKLIAFYTRRAKEEIGLIVTGGAAVSPEGRGGANFLSIYDDEDIDKFKQLTKAVHDVNGRIALQLFHAGRYAEKAYTGLDPVAPSPIKSPISRDVPKELTTNDIAKIIYAFEKGAYRAKLAGFDAVEIMGSEGYLINQFVSPVTNKRTDQWGGNFRNRVRFPLEIVKAVRKTVGPDYPIIFRMSGIDLIENSTTEHETIEFAQRLIVAGVDALNIGIGWHESNVPTISMKVPRMHFVPVAAKIKQSVSVPVIASNRINNPKDANDIIATGKADLVSMARPFLADPEILTKARNNRVDEINTCIACNQACLDHIFTGKIASCLVNPESGRETELTLTKAARKKKILVIGAGPAGLEVAKTAAMRNHLVTIVDEQPIIGGQINYAKSIPGKQEFTEMLRYFQVMLDKYGVMKKLGYRIDARDPLLKEADEIVIATGIIPRIPEIPGVEQNQFVFSYKEVLDGKIPEGKKLIIIGGGGIACDLASYLLAKNDYEITMLQRSKTFAKGLGKTTRWATLMDLRNKGVTMIGGVTYKEIDHQKLKVIINEAEVVFEADAIITATGQLPNQSLYQALQKKYDNIHVIGGARSAENLDAKRAIYEATILARSI